MVNLKTLSTEIITRLYDAGIESAEFEARELISHFFAVDKIKILAGENINVSEKTQALLYGAVEKRITHYPLQYILGEWEFYGLTFNVGEGVLIPRADTEILCEVSLNFLKGKANAKVIDICSGSGCIAITLDKNLNQSHNVFALEKYDGALKYLRENIKLNRASVEIICDDALIPKNCESAFDLIVSNPPYISAADMEVLQEEVRFEPKTALFAENEGLYFYEEITRIWSKRLANNGMLAFEIGKGYEDDVAQILLRAGLKDIKQYKDLSGIIRVVTATKIMEE